jgi:hypothetical protein
VNTLADAMLLLPAREGAKAADEGPIWFLVNRQDTGLAGKATSGEWTRTPEEHRWSTTYRSGGGYVYETSGTWTTWNWSYTPGSKGGGDSFRKLHIMERQGAQLVELSTRQEAERVLLRGLLFNNADLCAEGVGLKAGSWSWSLPGTMPPHSVRPFEVEGPADLLSRRLTQGGKAAQCSLAASPPFISARRRVVVGNAGSTPNFDYSTQPVDLASGPKASGANLTPH